jgi:hypothetical protein
MRNRKNIFGSILIVISFCVFFSLFSPGMTLPLKNNYRRKRLKPIFRMDRFKVPMTEKRNLI